MYLRGILASFLIVFLIITCGCSSPLTSPTPGMKQDVSAGQSIVEIPTLPEKYAALPAITPKSGSNHVANAELPEHLPLAQPAQRTVLTGTSLSGNAADSNITNASGSTPVAQFTSNMTVGYEPLTVQFMDSSLNKPTKWSWDFGDGNISKLQNPVHTYTSGNQQSAGISGGNVTGSGFREKYTVNLSVSNAYGLDNEIKTDYITVYPHDITLAPTPLPTTQVPTPVPTVSPTESPPPRTLTPTPTLTVSPTVSPTLTPTPTPIPTQTPVRPVKLIFIHHSSGENWLSDSNGGLGIGLKNQNFFVSDTNYGWGSIGDYTDIGNWWTWFRGPDSASIMSDVYAESGQHSSYSRLSNDPGGRNEIVMFKSCYPNSGLRGNVNDPIPLIENNPLKGESSGSEYHTISNAKGIYIDLLNYFQQHQDTLFVVVTAPPLSSPEYADNARAFNLWLVNDWLKNYPYKNVAVFDFYNVLTTNGGSTSINDAGQQTGNHHRMWSGVVQHQYDRQHNTLAYFSGDDHPSKAGNQKATTEFVPYLNFVYNQWKSNPTPVITSQPTTQPTTPRTTPPTTRPTTGPTTRPTVEPTIIPEGECFGADACNPTRNPIGGGAGYKEIPELLSATRVGAGYIVSTRDELLSALRNAKSGDTVAVEGTAVIDMTGSPSVTIPGGVTLASDRGLTGSSGALIKRTRNLNGGWEEPMFVAGGDNVRVTGLRLEGEMYPQDYGNGEVYPGSINERYYLVGLSATGVKNFEVDNNELRGWAWSSVSLRQCTAANIHHNYIHHNQARGEGYGVNLYGGNALIEANLFDYNRHDVTGAGLSGEQYEARYNHILGNGNAIGAAHFDVHQDEETGTGAAGAKFLIHHNTVDKGIVATVHIRARPTIGCYIYNNIINAKATDTGVPGGLPIYETNSNQNMFCKNNYWLGKLYSGNADIVWYQGADYLSSIRNGYEKMVDFLTGTGRK